MSLSTNTTYRVLVEKLGASDPSQFVGNEGEVFYDPSIPALKLSDGSTAGGLLISSGGGGGGGSIAGINTTGTSYFNQISVSGVSTIGNTVVGGASTQLLVNGNARITGILTVGTSSITLDGSTNTVKVGSGITINGSTGTINASSINLGGTVLTGVGVTYITAGSGISVDQNTGNVTITATGGGSSSQWVTTGAGIHTLSNVGIGTTNPQTKLEVDGILGFGKTFTRSGNNINNIRIGDKTTGANLIPNPNASGAPPLIGLGNVFIGNKVGSATTNGRYNSFFGYVSGQNSRGVTSNSFFGSFSGAYNLTGSYNSFFGHYSGGGNISGSHNSFFGAYAGYGNASGSDNIFFGSYSGISTSASYKVILGSGKQFNQLFDAPDTTKSIQFAVGVKTDANPSKYWLVGNENFNIGIGTTNPKTKLQVGGVIGFNDSNVRIGDNTTGANLTPLTLDPAQGNIFIGVGAGSSTTSADDNIFLGRFAGEFNNTGGNNLFFGKFAGRTNTGNLNTFVGNFSGNYNTTGEVNSFFGLSSGSNNTTGNYNSFFGGYAGYFNNIGNSNVFLGTYVGLSTSASRKVVLGSSYYYQDPFDSPDTTKDTQFAVGIKTDANESKYWLVGNENFNIGIGTTNPQTKLEIDGILGFSTAYELLTGATFNNIRIGDKTTGANLNPNDGNSSYYSQNNIFIGSGAGTGHKGLISEVSIGSSTVINIGSVSYYTIPVVGGSGTDAKLSAIRNGFGYLTITPDIPYFGKNYQVGDVINIDGADVGGVSGIDDVTVTVSGIMNSVGFRNNFIGNYVANNYICMNSNNFFGNYAGYYSTGGTCNNFFGTYAGYCNTTGSENNFFGLCSGLSNTSGCYNNFFGSTSGNCNTTGNCNSFFGVRAGYYNTTGSNNNFFGYGSGYCNTTGNYNNFFGGYAGGYNTTGEYNNFLGHYSGLSTSSSYKVIIGSGINYSTVFDSPDINKDTQLAIGINTSGTSEYWLVGNENFNIGIGTTNPTQRLEVQNGDIKVGVNTSNGVILTDANGVAWRLIVNTDGTLSTSAV